MTALRLALLGSVCLSAFHSTAAAQTVSPDLAEPETEQREIVVTGSRILRRDFTAESPITTVDQSFIQDSGPATLEQTLNALPQFQASQNAQTTSISTFGAGSSGARSSANLRGLGPSRTLVLFDGRRLQPSDVLGTIDLNTIAPSLIGSAEVITGGASAVYGSDAIAGVVNFRFNSKFRGLELQAETGIAQLGDASSNSASLTWGGSVADDRGRLFLSASYLGRGTASRDERRFFDNRLGTATPSNGLIVLEGANRFGGGSAAAVAAYRNLFLNTYGTAIPPAASSLLLNPDGTLIGNTGAINLRPDPITGYVVGATGTVTQRALRDATLQLPLDRYSGFARGEFDISDNATIYAQAMYTWYKSDQVSDAGVTQSVVDPIRIRADNPFVTPDLRVALNSRPNPAGSIVYYFNTSRIGLLQVQQEYDVAQGLVGLKGAIGSSSLRYDVYASYGRTREDERTINSVSRSRLNTLLNGVDASGAPDGGRSVCAGGYNPFAFGPVSRECSEYLTIDPVNRYRFEQTVVQANLTGDLFALPGGSAAFAIGAEYRSNSYRADIDPRNSPTPTGPSGATTSPDALGTSGAFSSRGDINVRELYGELALPLLSNRPFFESLDLSLAYRFSDYNRIGGTHTYKASGNWSPLRSVSVRGGYSRAIRAPSLGELFAPLSGATGVIGLASAGAGDPCDVTGLARNGKVAGVDPAEVAGLCVATGVPTTTLGTYRYSGTANAAQRIGNLNLKEETADSYTIGLVVEPEFAKPMFRALSLSVDYFDIRLKDAIGYVTSPIALNQCFNFGGLNPNYEASNFYCQLITRDSAGVLATIREPLFNLGAYRTSGIDFQANAAIGVGQLGTLLLNSSVTYVIDYKIQNLSTEPFNDYAGTIGNSQIDGFSSTHPAWKHVTSAALSGSNGSLTFRWRYIGAQENSSNVGNPTGSAPGVPAVSYFDLIGRIRANDAFELRAGITNLTDKQPPEFGGPASTATSAYDIIGRRFFVGASARF